MKRTNRHVFALTAALALSAVACGDVTGPHPGIETSPINPPRRTGVIVQRPQLGIETSPRPKPSGVVNQGPQRGGIIVDGPQRGVGTSPGPRR